MAIDESELNLGGLKTGEAGIKAFAEALHAEHRTTQALVVQTVLRGLLRWAEESRDGQRTDLRNERAVGQVLALLPGGAERELYVC